MISGEGIGTKPVSCNHDIGLSAYLCQKRWLPLPIPATAPGKYIIRSYPAYSLLLWPLALIFLSQSNCIRLLVKTMSDCQSRREKWTDISWSTNVLYFQVWFLQHLMTGFDCVNVQSSTCVNFASIVLSIWLKRISKYVHPSINCSSAFVSDDQRTTP